MSSRNKTQAALRESLNKESEAVAKRLGAAAGADTAKEDAGSAPAVAAASAAGVVGDATAAEPKARKAAPASRAGKQKIQVEGAKPEAAKRAPKAKPTTAGTKPAAAPAEAATPPAAAAAEAGAPLQPKKMRTVKKPAKPKAAPPVEAPAAPAAPAAEAAAPPQAKKARAVKKPAKPKAAAEEGGKDAKPSPEAAEPVRKDKREKVVRDSFSMPAGEHKQIKAIRENLGKAGRLASKSEVLRSALKLLATRSPAEISSLIDALPPVPKGKHGKKA